MSAPRAQIFEAALNGVLGDYLVDQHPELAIELGLYRHGRILPLTREAWEQAYPKASPQVCVWVHGSSYDESCWAFPGQPELSYGALLEQELGWTALYLRYNSGLHVSQNGRAFADVLERLWDVYPAPIQALSLVGHSMGGLLIRSACHYGVEAQHRWVKACERAIYLGSPHLGSPHEKAGQLASAVLEAIPDPVVQLAARLAKLRSAGVKDLRHGSLRDEDWQGRDPDRLSAERPLEVPLAPGIEHFLGAATLTLDQGHLLTRLLGDALVRVPSALAPGAQAGLPPDHLRVFTGMHHMGLVHSPEVYAQLRRWFGAEADALASSPPHELAAAPASTLEERLRRANAYRGLVQDAIERGATAVQQVQEALTARPYDLLEQVPPLEGPVKLVKAVHFGVMKGSYQTIRVVNRWTGAALSRAFDAAKNRK